MQRGICLGYIAFVAAILLSGCNGNTPAAQLEKERNLPKLDRSDSVAGPDSDGNGVRDDIDAYLRQRFPKLSQHAAAIQMAKAMQSAVVVDASNHDASQTASIGLSNAIHCLFIRFDPKTIGADSPEAVCDEIEALTANTRARVRAYMAYNKSRDGTTSTSPDGDSCE